jgi:hypothetical protein
MRRLALGDASDGSAICPRENRDHDLESADDRAYLPGRQKQNAAERASAVAPPGAVSPAIALKESRAAMCRLPACSAPGSKRPRRCGKTEKAAERGDKREGNARPGHSSLH